MRVGLVCPYDLGKPGGVQAQVLGLARYLNARGDEALVMGPGLPDEVGGVDLGGTVRIPANGSMVPLSMDPRVAADLKQAARDVDLLHVHEPLMPFVSLTALRAGKPVVGTFHAAPGSLGTGFYSILRSGVKRVMGPNVRRVTAVSKTAARPLPPQLDVEVVPNGVDTAYFDVDMKRSSTRVSFLGRDERRKGLDVLLKAWPSVVDHIPGAELVVMGADRGTPGITWMGRVDDVRKAEVLAGSAVYVAPNLGGESFGITLVEAMAAGAPVVASSLDSFEEVGGDAVTYFDTGNASALSECLVAMLRDEGRRSAMSSAGRERARLFDWAAVVERYRSVYLTAVS